MTKNKKKVQFTTFPNIYISLSLLSSNHETDLGSVTNLEDGSLQHNVCPLCDVLMGAEEVIH